MVTMVIRKTKMNLVNIFKDKEIKVVNKVSWYKVGYGRAPLNLSYLSEKNEFQD